MFDKINALKLFLRLVETNEKHHELVKGIWEDSLEEKKKLLESQLRVEQLNKDFLNSFFLEIQMLLLKEDSVSLKVEISDLIKKFKERYNL